MAPKHELPPTPLASSDDANPDTVDGDRNVRPREDAPATSAQNPMIQNIPHLQNWVETEYRIGARTYTTFRGILVGQGTDGAPDFHETAEVFGRLPENELARAGSRISVGSPELSEDGLKVVLYNNQVTYELHGEPAGPKLVVDMLGQYPPKMNGGQNINNQVTHHLKPVTEQFRFSWMWAVLLGVLEIPLINHQPLHHSQETKRGSAWGLPVLFQPALPNAPLCERSCYSGEHPGFPGTRFHAAWGVQE